ncbi:MAG: hypothetical protein ABSA46_01595 [Thermodesulfovibrionales bacterium]|jgi:predicted transcriptional regulator
MRKKTTPRKSKLDAPHIKAKVVKELAVRKTQAAIAAEQGLNQSSVSRFAHREDVKPYIEQEQMKLLDGVDDAVQNILRLVRTMKDVPKKELKRLELHYKASMDLLKAVGIMPTPLQSQTIQNIFNQNVNAVISAECMSLLATALGGEPIEIIPCQGVIAPPITDAAPGSDENGK